MQTTHTLKLTPTRATFLLSALLVGAGLLFAFEPVRQVAAARASVGTNPAVAKLISQIGRASCRERVYVLV